MYIFILSAEGEKKKTLFQVIQVAVMLCYDADYSSLSYYVNDVHPQSDQKSP